jgi:hypothetical protein
MLRRTLARAAPLVAVAALLGGCGIGGAPPASETLPSCDDVWVAGGTIPDGYTGCRDGDGVLQVSDLVECTESDGTLTTFGGTFFGLVGEAVHDGGLASPGYTELRDRCVGSTPTS